MTKDYVERQAETLRKIKAIANKEGLPELASLAREIAQKFEDYKERQEPYQYREKPEVTS